jgi:hypothetical protein
LTQKCENEKNKTQIKNKKMSNIQIKNKMKTSKNNLMLLIPLLLMLGAASAKAQMRMGGTTAPEPNAILDLNANNTDNGTKGLLLPRVALAATTEASPLSAHVQGMYVYNTATANDVSPGVYYNNGAKWIRSEDETNLDFNTKHLEIEINETIRTQSMIYHGITSEVSSDLKVLSVKPVFSDDIMALTLFNVSGLAKYNEAGTAVRWVVKITNSNIDPLRYCELRKVIISYVCNEELEISSLTEAFVLVGQ